MTLLNMAGTIHTVDSVLLGFGSAESLTVVMAWNSLSIPKILLPCTNAARTLILEPNSGNRSANTGLQLVVGSCLLAPRPRVLRVYSAVTNHFRQEKYYGNLHPVARCPVC